MYSSEQLLVTIHNAAANGDLVALESLVAGKSGGLLLNMLEARDALHWTPLHHAAFNGHANFVEKLLSTVNPNPHAYATDGLGETPLTLAAGGGHLEVVKLLLQHKEDDVMLNNIVIQKIQGEFFTNEVTPLSEAIKYGRYEVARELIKAGANMSSYSEWHVFFGIYGLEGVMKIAPVESESEMLAIICGYAVFQKIERLKTDSSSVEMIALYNGLQSLLLAAADGGAEAVGLEWILPRTMQAWGVGESLGDTSWCALSSVLEAEPFQKNKVEQIPELLDIAYLLIKIRRQGMIDVVDNIINDEPKQSASRQVVSWHFKSGTKVGAVFKGEKLESGPVIINNGAQMVSNNNVVDKVFRLSEKANEALQYNPLGAGGNALGML